MYWDGEAAPSVEVPVGDFFANGHAMRCDIDSIPVCVNPSGGMNSYWPMPFSDSARITIANEHGDDIRGFFYQITYSLTETPSEAGRFHAQWRRENTVTYHKEYTILDGVRGRGHYVGTYLAWTQLSSGWWGEGEIKFYVDGDDPHPTICGTGTEDYVGGAWCFADRTYSKAFLGYPLRHAEPGQIIRHGLYRWHVPDPIRFKSDLRVTQPGLDSLLQGKGQLQHFIGFFVRHAAGPLVGQHVSLLPELVELADKIISCAKRVSQGLDCPVVVGACSAGSKAFRCQSGSGQLDGGTVGQAQPGIGTEAGDPAVAEVAVGHGQQVHHLLRSCAMSGQPAIAQPVVQGHAGLLRRRLSGPSGPR